MVLRRFVGLGTAIFMLTAAGSATAATITVTVTYDDQFAGDGQCSLRKAINDVNSPGSSQTNLAALTSAWSAGPVWPSSSLSAYLS